MKRIREFENQSRLNSGLVYILLWGTPFFLLVTVWRYFTDQEPAFDNHLILLLMSLIGGFFFGLLVWAKDKNTETTT